MGFPTKNDHFGVEIGGTTIYGNTHFALSAKHGFCWNRCGLPTTNNTCHASIAKNPLPHWHCYYSQRQKVPHSEKTVNSPNNTQQKPLKPFKTQLIISSTGTLWEGISSFSSQEIYPKKEEHVSEKRSEVKVSNLQSHVISGIMSFQESLIC